MEIKDKPRNRSLGLRSRDFAPDNSTSSVCVVQNQTWDLVIASEARNLSFCFPQDEIKAEISRFVQHDSCGSNGAAQYQDICYTALKIDRGHTISSLVHDVKLPVGQRQG